MFTQGGLIVKKKEMTRVSVDGSLIPVTLIQLLNQKVIRHKTKEKDGYVALVVGVVGKNGEIVKQKEFNLSEGLLSSFPVGHVFKSDFLNDISDISLQGVSKGKGFAGVIKRHHMAGMPHTHGHKYRRVGGSKGNRKPRRGFKGHPHAGHMGAEVVTIKNIKVLQNISFEGESLLVVKGSVPGAYNSHLYLYR